MRDALETLLSVRKLTVDEARCQLTSVLEAADAARTQADEADAQIGQEGAIASDLNAGDHAVEAFVAWLPVGRATAAEARARHEQSLLDVACARARLNAALIAAESAENYLKLRQKERLLAEKRRNEIVNSEIVLQKAIVKAQDSSDL